ncbi:DUF998 domain-containing protein [Nocardia amikacinitolerans]|uniref:DUF998 domain-containing protein n=1 Tax=Nocardia amikacinitolerans TaxID=756689 RepID=UPI0035586C5A
MRRALTTGVGRTWVPRLVGVFAAAMIGTGVFVCDPYQGYPGRDGPPHLGLLHSARPRTEPEIRHIPASQDATDLHISNSTTPNRALNPNSGASLRARMRRTFAYRTSGFGPAVDRTRSPSHPEPREATDSASQDYRSGGC